MYLQLLLLVCLGWFGCAAYPSCGVSLSDAGSYGDRDGGQCLDETPCVNDTQCVSVSGASCNTRTNKCQIVKCGGERTPCSIDDHCKMNHRCENGACKHDPTPRCYSKAGSD